MSPNPSNHDEPITPPSLPPTEPVVVDTGLSAKQPIGHKGLAVAIVISLAVLALIVGGVVMAAQSSINAFKAIDWSSSETDSESDSDPIIKDNSAVIEKDVDQTIVDTDLGYSIHASKVILDPFPIPQYFEGSDNEVVVLVEYTLTNERGAIGGPTYSTIQLVTEDGKQVTATMFSNSDLTENEYTPLPVGSADEGEPISGYVAYWVPENQANRSLSIRYDRRATYSYSENKSLDAKTFEVKLY